MNEREAAFKILCDIEIEKNSPKMAINKIFKNEKINDKDKGLATELVYGVIENRKYLDVIVTDIHYIVYN